MASSIDSKWKRDVFLSFRGEDTRNNFCAHLYASLARSGINTFKDDVKLRKGEEISPALLTAIEESRFSIVILSKNYATSKWCLDELDKILQCKSNGQTVYPIFYDVDTSDVRNQKGNFKEALENHERTLIKPDLEKVQRWRLALNKVANLSGWDTKNRNEQKIIQEIVERISKQKLSSTKISIAKHPVGIQSHVQEISKLLEIDSKEVRKKVGIYGCKGIGTTTIAKAIYNWHASQFDRCCFLMDVRDRSKDQYQIVKLQKLLLHEILGEDLELDNMDRGSTVIKERLRQIKVLIVIDGVGNTDINPLDKLAEKLDWFGPGSRIIITTTDKHLLDTQEDVHSPYEVKTMGQSDAIQLFSWYAFKENKPKVDHMKLVNFAVRYTKGLPSALVKLGSDLCSRSMDYWESTLLKNNASEVENHNDIWIRLNDFAQRHSNDETREIPPSLLQLFKGALESSSDVHPNFNMNTLEQCADVDWKDEDFDLQSIKFEQSAEETSHPDADRTRVDEISKQGMKASQGQNENPYAGATQDVEKGEPWRNASQGGNYDPCYGGASNDNDGGQGASESPYDGGPTEHGVAGQSGNYNLHYGGAGNADDDDDAGQGAGEKPYYGGPTDHGGARNDDDDNDNNADDDGQGASESAYYGGPPDHGVADGGARNADDDNDDDGQGAGEKPYYGGARNDDDDNDNNADDDGQGASESAYYGGPPDHGVADGGARNADDDNDDDGQGAGEKPYYGGARNDDDDNDNNADDDGQGASESSYDGGPTEHGVAGQSGNYNLHYGGAGNADDDDDARQGVGEKPYYGEPTDHGGARNDDDDNDNNADDDGQGASESTYYGGPPDHGVADGGARNADDDNDDDGQGTGEKPYYGGARNDDDDNDNNADDDGQGASESAYYGGPLDHGVADGGARNADDDNDDDGQGAGEKPYYGGARNDDDDNDNNADDDGQGASESAYYGGPPDHGVADGGPINADDDNDDDRQGAGEKPYYGGARNDDDDNDNNADDDGQGASESAYYGGPPDHGVADGGARNADDDNDDDRQGAGEKPYYGGARNDDDDNDNNADDDGQGASESAYYGGPPDHGVADGGARNADDDNDDDRQGAGEKPYYGGARNDDDDNDNNADDDGQD